MPVLKVTSKGQVTFRRNLLQHLGVKPGQKIEVRELPEGRIMVEKSAKSGNLSNFIGFLSDNGKGRSLTLDEMKEIASEGWTSRK